MEGKSAFEYELEKGRKDSDIRGRVALQTLPLQVVVAVSDVTTMRVTTNHGTDLFPRLFSE